MCVCVCVCVSPFVSRVCLTVLVVLVFVGGVFRPFYTCPGIGLLAGNIFVKDQPDGLRVGLPKIVPSPVYFLICPKLITLCFYLSIFHFTCLFTRRLIPLLLMPLSFAPCCR